jgi:TPR repeat protein/pimeloyl-ACP methyl ester carboxylesterase
MKRVAIVFVHGLFSSAHTWDAFRDLIQADQELAGIDLFDFEYPSPKIRLNPLKRIPDFNTLADSLQTLLETLQHPVMILVSHSQGGLIVQRYLARMVMNARGRELERIRRVVMFACPNSGSQFFLTLRKATPAWSHPQERQLRPLNDAVSETQRVVINRVVHASSISSDQCPVDVRAYAGEEDNVVTPASALGVFPNTGVLPGDHFSIIQPDSTDHRAYQVLKANIRAILPASAAETVRSSEVQDYGEVPRVTEMGLHELGVHPAAQPDESAVASERFDRLPVYVPRDCDEQIEHAISQGGLVVVEGRSAAGKSRAAAEAIRRVAPGRHLFVPQDHAALMALAEPPGGLRDAVIWLDDLERYWGETGFDAHLINRLSPTGRTDVAIVATLRSEARRHMETPPSRLSHLLRAATIVRPGFKPTPAERKRAEERRSDPRIAQWLDRGGETGLAEYLAAGPAALDRWLSGRDGAELAGAALVSAAVDCRRAGYRKPLPLALLTDLCPHYLDTRDARRSDLANLDESLAWATTPVCGASACLLPFGNGKYGAFDYLVDHVERDDSAALIPEAVWRALLAHATDDDLTVIIVAAQNDAVDTKRPALMDIALARYGQVREFDQIGRQVAMMFVASNGGEGWDFESRYEGWLRPFVEAGNSQAMAALGALLHGCGRPEEGEAWMRRAAAAGNDGAAADVAQLLYQSHRSAELDDWLDRAVADGRGLIVTYFAGHLIEQGEEEEANQRLHRAAEAQCIPAITTLAGLAEKQGDVGKAKAWYERAVALDDPAAMVNLGVLCLDDQEWEQAENLLHAAAVADQVLGMYNLALMLQPIIERRQEAENWFRRAAEAGDQPAAVELAHMMHERRDSIGLAEWLERARENENGGQTVRDLAIRLARQGDMDAAERWYRYAVDLGQLDAMTGLADVLRQRGDAEEAMSWYRKAADSGEIRAQVSLGAKLSETGDLEEAERWLKGAATMVYVGEARTKYIAKAQVDASYNLAILLRRQGRDDEAEKWFQRAAEEGDVDAMYNLGRMLSRRGRPEEAQKWLRSAAEHGDADAAKALRHLPRS